MEAPMPIGLDDVRRVATGCGPVANWAKLVRGRRAPVARCLRSPPLRYRSAKEVDVEEGEPLGLIRASCMHISDRAVPSLVRGVVFFGTAGCRL